MYISIHCVEYSSLELNVENILYHAPWPSYPLLL